MCYFNKKHYITVRERERVSVCECVCVRVCECVCDGCGVVLVACVAEVVCISSVLFLPFTMSNMLIHPVCCYFLSVATSSLFVHPVFYYDLMVTHILSWLLL